MKGILEAGIYGLYNWSNFAERYNRKGTLQIQEIIIWQKLQPWRAQLQLER